MVGHADHHSRPSVVVGIFYPLLDEANGLVVGQHITHVTNRVVVVAIEPKKREVSSAQAERRWTTHAAMSIRLPSIIKNIPFPPSLSRYLSACEALRRMTGVSLRLRVDQRPSSHLL